MGVPAFFRWLSRKYPNIIVHCVEEKAHNVDGNERINVDSSKPNPNNVEFDNLYLDMNGIIHPCCHPENKPAPKNEDEMMKAMFEYIDRLFSIIRPRKLLYMAIDGVAPRAKMNQQRSRRFRASKEAAEKAETITRLRQELLAKGFHLPPEKAPEEHFDTNCITPGTPFMDRLSKCLHYYIHDRLNNDPGWKNIEVILSDANVPGEGEHKIVDFIRRQRVSPTHNPNTKHCLCGADADLIMLGLATHEAHFTIIREEFKPNQPRPCELCGQVGHDMKDCMGLPRDVASQTKLEKPFGAETEFIFIRLYVLREYLTKELWIEGLPFEWSIERAIDDWVFLCFFVGNDFLPHLPSLEIREGAIDRLVRIYKETIHVKKDYLTQGGFTKLDHCCLILTKLGQAEDEIFRQRQIDEEKFKRRQKERNAMRRQEHAQPSYHMVGQFRPTEVCSGPTAISGARNEVINQRRVAMEFSRGVHTGVGIEALLEPEGDRQAAKRKKEEEEEEEEPEDEVRLWECGWKERYYESKFEVSPENQSYRHEVAAAYAEGLCWVLRYYYQGCPSWKWFYPYHYAPFASDFSEIGSLNITFDEQTQPFKPMEQLMSVFPAASRQHLPESWGDLMEDPESPIIDFYPTDFRVDLNGKKAAWMGVALLPFVDEKRLLETVQTVYDQLTPEEKRQNSRGDSYIFIRKNHPGYPFLRGLYENKSWMKLNDDLAHQVQPEQFHGITGEILTTSKVVPEKEKVLSPVRGCQPCLNNMVVVLRWRDPTVAPDFVFPAVMLPGAIPPAKELKPEDLVGDQRRQWRPQVGMARNTQRASLGPSGHRMVNHYANVPPMYSGVSPRVEPQHSRPYVRPYRRNFEPDYDRRSSYGPNYGYADTAGGYQSNPGYHTGSSYDSQESRRPLQDSRGPPRERFGNPANRQPHRSTNDRQQYGPPADRNHYGQRFAYGPPMDRPPYGPRLGFGPPRGGSGRGGMSRGSSRD